MKQFTEKDMVDFGNYLLSKERQEKIENKDNVDKVHDVDLSNWSLRN